MFSLNNYLKHSIKIDKTKVIWTQEADTAVETCRRKPSLATLLTFPSSTDSLALTTDASSTAIGTKLEQLEEDTWKPLGFFSGKLSDTEKRYITYNRKLLAILAAAKFFYHLIECRKLVVKTDHKPLIHAFKQKTDKSSERQFRQLDLISQLSTVIVYVKGNENTVIDALSRINAIDMPTVLTPLAIHEAQQNNQELVDLIQNSSSLKLQKLCIEGSDVYCDIATGIVKPSIPEPCNRVKLP